jgi:hypothetical protein
MKGQRIRRQIERFCHAPGGKSVRPGLDQEAENIEAVILGEGCQSPDGV